VRDLIERLHERRAEVERGGGEERAARQHEQGKLTARERLSLLFDEGSYQELGAFVQHRGRDFGLAGRDLPGDAVVTAYGPVNGRLVYAFSQDFTVLGGTLGEMHADKICRMMDLALQNGCPVVGINDSGGARIQEGVDALNGFGRIFSRNTRASGVIPQISVIAGPCAGGAVYSPALTDFVLMAEGTGRMFITGPDVIRAVSGEEVTHEELGGAAVHTQKSGVAHLAYAGEEHLFAATRRLLALLPSNYLEDPPISEERQPDGEPENLLDLVPVDPRRSYDVKRVLHCLLDRDSWFEIHPRFAENVVVGFGRVGGQVMGIVANQPKVLAGCLDIDSSDKIARHVRLCDAFNIPLLTLVDTPGYLPGVRQEYGGIIRHGAKVLYAYSEATVPKISIVLRKAYGGAYLAMCSRSLGADIALAWPSAEIAVMGPEGACNIVFRREIASAEDAEKARQEKVAEYRDRFANPYTAAARGFIDDVIDPRDTRGHIMRALQATRNKRGSLPPKKHGSIPV